LTLIISVLCFAVVASIGVCGCWLVSRPTAANPFAEESFAKDNANMNKNYMKGYSDGYQKARDDILNPPKTERPRLRLVANK